MKPIPYARQCISQQDIDAVVQVLKSDWLTQGPSIEKFEQKVADYCGAKYAIAVSSATAALHISCMAAELASDDILWTSPNSFVASANCGLYCGAKVDFVDIDPETYNMSCVELANKLKTAKHNGNVPKVLVPVHFSGQSCDMEQISSLAKNHGITIIEDASHAIGGKYKGFPVGSCKYSDMTVFSFHPVKIITTGEGGMILTNRSDLYEKLLLLRSHGITRNPNKMIGASEGPWYYQQVALGYNYRITDLQAALGSSQMDRLDEFVIRRQDLARRYGELLAALPVKLPFQHRDAYSAYHLYVIGLKLDQITKSHCQVFEELHHRGVCVNLHYIPIHTQPYYLGLGFKKGDFPNSERYYQEAMSLPMYYSLSNEEQEWVVDQLKDVLK